MADKIREIDLPLFQPSISDHVTSDRAVALPFISVLIRYK